MKKKILFVLMVAFMSFSLVACGSKEKLFVKTVEELCEKEIIISSFNSYIINVVLEMNEDGRLRDFFDIPFFNDYDIYSFEEYKSYYEKYPNGLGALEYDIIPSLTVDKK